MAGTAVDGCARSVPSRVGRPKAGQLSCTQLLSQLVFQQVYNFQTMNALSMQLDEMGKAVDVAERQKQRFGLTQQEVIERRKWVHSARQQVGTAAATAQSMLTCCSLGQHTSAPLICLRRAVV